MPDVHPLARLWSTHHPVGGYPQGVEAVPESIPGLAFFPGGWGLYRADPDAPLPPMPTGGIMVLGHDFHSRSGYDASLRLGGERLTLPTWRTLLKVLAAAAIAPEDCFFTNLYMGLRSGEKTTGIFLGASDVEFRRHCQDFLLRQISVQRPRVILPRGVQVPPVIAELSDQPVETISVDFQRRFRSWHRRIARRILSDSSSQPSSPPRPTRGTLRLEKSQRPTLNESSRLSSPSTALTEPSKH